MSVRIGAEERRSQSTGVDPGRSQRFSTGVGAGPGVGIFDWNRRRCRSRIDF